ncbi:hypothetical protein B0H66DRAFT_558342 [Apodospora peruviana]|uniref:Uncharacterized protein n=1 Tax=Apodospora peruviana TaxID=516989 RepID=A0AAE0I5N1_9PEZI|nr:hypothetical protein B0H66DRAFT_558342 [Apodospora peruviana]
MPSNNSGTTGGGGGGNQNSNKSTSSSKSSSKQPMSDYEFLKPWGGMNNFMLSHGLKMHDPADVAEAHQIIDQMRQQGGYGRSPYR